MARPERLSRPLIAAVAATFVLVAAWSAEPPSAPEPSPTAAPATQPGADAAAPRQRIKPSDPPHLGLFFTDQVVGYIQPCG